MLGPLLGKNCVGVLQARVFGANLLCVCLGAIRIRDFSLNAHWFPMIICHDPQTEQGCHLSVVQINLLLQRSSLVSRSACT